MRGPFRESELAEAPPHQAELWFSFLPCRPLHSPSQTGVNALMASGARCAGRLRQPNNQHHARVSCALMASMRTRFHSSSTLSTKALALRMSGASLSNLVSTMALMRPGLADITATRSAR
jgi:hypothetical protein